jgi:hypothetical protein
LVWGTYREEQRELTDGMRNNAEFPADRPSWLGSRQRARSQSISLISFRISTPEARRDVDAVAKDVVFLNDHVAQIDADAKLHPPCRRCRYEENRTSKMPF